MHFIISFVFRGYLLCFLSCTCTGTLINLQNCIKFFYQEIFNMIQTNTCTSNSQFVINACPWIKWRIKIIVRERHQHKMSTVTSCLFFLKYQLSTTAKVWQLKTQFCLRALGNKSTVVFTFTSCKSQNDDFTWKRMIICVIWNIIKRRYSIFISF